MQQNAYYESYFIKCLLQKENWWTYTTSTTFDQAGNISSLIPYLHEDEQKNWVNNLIKERILKLAVGFPPHALYAINQVWCLVPVFLLMITW